MSDEHQPQASSIPSSASPMELGDLSAQAATQEQQQQHSTGPISAQALELIEHERGPTQVEPIQNERVDQVDAPAATTSTRSAAPSPITVPPTSMKRRDTEAIGPSTDLPTPMLASFNTAAVQGPVIQFTLLLALTGTRHQYQLNERYLGKRNIKAQDDAGNFDPSIISVYTLKELILKDWRDDWEARPSSPSSIRLIFFGQLLNDNASLKDCKFNLEGSANVVHVSVKPQDMVDDEEGGKAGKSSMSRDRDGSERTPGCRCVIL